MVESFAGKVAFITGVARGLGRNHAVRLARSGATVVGIDISEDGPTDGSPTATSADLAETRKLIEAEGADCQLTHADVRDLDAVIEAADRAVESFGGIDIVIANAGICKVEGSTWELSAEQWQKTIDVNLTGVFNTFRATVPAMITAGRGGSIIAISSTAGLKGIPGQSHYSASKHGVMGLVKSLANELFPHNIRVNAVNPGSVGTVMIRNDAMYQEFRPDVPQATEDDAIVAMTELNGFAVPWVEVDDVSDAVLWLASESSRYVTGHALPVDAGFMAK
jgi:(+)-trans-carveol dehydrogenase